VLTDDLRRRVASIPGWLTLAQADLLSEHAAAVPEGGVVVEIGSHQGRSTVTLGGSVRTGARVVAVDPFPSTWRYGGEDTESRLRAHLSNAGLTDVVEVRTQPSAEVLATWRGRLDLVFVDGKHDVASVVHDLRWARHLPLGGRILVHDSFSSIGVTLALLVRILPSNDLRYLGRVGSLAVFERGRPTTADRRQLLAQLPWWLRNLGIKALLRLRLRPVAALVGHHDSADPY
jgi:hypothetical protein